MMYFFRVYHFLKHRKMFVNQHGGVKMALYSHDVTFHRVNGRIRLLKTYIYKLTYIAVCQIFGLRRPGVNVYMYIE